jgi:hypothetical protein
MNKKRISMRSKISPLLRKERFGGVVSGKISEKKSISNKKISHLLAEVGIVGNPKM